MKKYTFGICLLLVITMYHSSTGQSLKNVQPAVDSLQLQLSEAERMAVSNVNFYKIHSNKKGRKLRVKGYAVKTSTSYMPYLFLISDDKIEISRRGVKLRTITYYSYNFKDNKNVEKIIRSEKQVLVKTEVNDSLISGMFYLPDNSVRRIVNGSYFKVDPGKNIFNKVVYNKTN